MNELKVKYTCENYSSTLLVNITYEYIPTEEALTLTVVVLIFLLTSLVGNIAAVVVVYRNRYLHDPSGILIGALAVSDIGVGFSSVISTIIYDNPCSRLNHAVCVFLAFMSSSFIGSTYSAIAGITVDRCIAICKPLHYRQYVTNTRIIQILLFNWLCILALAALPIMGLQQYGIGKYEYVPYLTSCWIDITAYSKNYLAIIVFYLPVFSILILVMICYVIILLKANSTFKRMAISGWIYNENKQLLKKSTRTTIIVVGVFFICTTPGLALTFATLVNQGSVVSGKAYKYLLNWGIYVNITVNPLLFGFSHKDFRHGYHEICSHFYSKKSKISDISLPIRPSVNPSILSGYNLVQNSTL
ncbi:uncharacterized protein TRIADDRAFT_58722 [Trichoplax adhaerens]|uniref:G-protein coupled receptors family 1 profile domain-containing protein n=1 Tax=Trichoplax adhaerens TaxID=10228 RepID=B3S3H4_TRIAD|nr:hypothetical protein TRIADDRAFT_58722 [Trichoplax adhaerens]EDV22791.1 hypothetical protein TRIADDRAFT_58722 [Trichoplax adhaerens]|eukprot:XP_002114657.1 hypothetical protein TRIADDRAFT_58722 [Trichoplax adhaerens]